MNPLLPFPSHQSDFPVPFRPVYLSTDDFREANTASPIPSVLRPILLARLKFILSQYAASRQKFNLYTTFLCRLIACVLAPDDANSIFENETALLMLSKHDTTFNFNIEHPPSSPTVAQDCAVPSNPQLLPNPLKFDQLGTRRRDISADDLASSPPPLLHSVLRPGGEEPLKPPFYAPITICGPNGNAFNVLAFVDSGADYTYLNTSFYEKLGVSASPSNFVTRLASADAPAQRNLVLDSPIYVWCGSFSVRCQPSVLTMDVNLVPYMCMGRDLMHYFNITVSGIPIQFPISKSAFGLPANETDINDRSSTRVSDTPLTPADEILRSAVRSAIQDSLLHHADTVPVNSFINHPDAEVQILHVPDTPPSYIPQYPNKNVKSAMDPYITDQVELWKLNGKLVDWDNSVHGAWAQHNIPLLPVITHDELGNIKKVRVCVDARGINKGLVTDNTPIPNISHMYSTLANYNFYSEFDLVSAFNQFHVKTEHQHKLAITWENKRYCFAGAPFGVKHLSSHVQRVLSKIFAHLPFVHIYLDNIIIASTNLAEHQDMCLEFIRTCTAHNILLDPAKCKLAMTSLRTLGNVITSSGVSADPTKIQTVLNWQKPTNGSQMASFLSFANYLRGYVRHYADIVAPLDKFRNKKLTSITWTPDMNKACDLLLHALAHAPAINFPNYEKPFAIACDSSIYGIGAVLFQPNFPGELPTVENIVSFTSRALHDSERHYSVYKLELNALIYGIKQFEEALYGRHFTVYTDHQSLVFLNTQKDMNRILRNWYAFLQEFDFTVTHVPGHINQLADSLSRMYEPANGQPWGMPMPRPPPLSVGSSTESNKTNLFTTSSASFNFDNSTSMFSPSNFTSAYFHALTVFDSSLATDTDVEPSSTSKFFNNIDPLSTIDHHTLNQDDDSPATQIFKQPDSAAHAQRLVTDAHAHGHFGSRAVHAALRRDGWRWRGMSGLIHAVCTNCPACLSWNASRRIFHPTSSVDARIPWDCIQIDISSVMSDKPANDYKYVLVVTDMFSSFTILRPLKTKTALEISHNLYEIFCTFGPPRLLQSDNGDEFLNKLTTELTNAFKITHRTITAYNPRSAGKVERHVGIASATLKKLLHSELKDGTLRPWPEMLPFVQLVMNVRHQQLTNSSPFALMFNRTCNQWQSYTSQDFENITAADYAAWQQREKQLHETVFPVIRQRVHSLQDQYNKSFQPRSTTKNHLSNGSLVMLRDVLRKNKLEEPWLGPYTVVRCHNNAYTLRDFAGGIFQRDVPRDQLKFINSSDLRDQDGKSFYVDRITDHRVEINDDGSPLTQYLVKFVGQDTPEWTDSHDIDQSLIATYLSNKTQLPRNLLTRPDGSKKSSPKRTISSPISSSSSSASVSPRITSLPHIPAVSPSPPVRSVSWTDQNTDTVLSRSSRSRAPNSQLRDSFL